MASEGSFVASRTGHGRRIAGAMVPALLLLLALAIVADIVTWPGDGLDDTVSRRLRHLDGSVLEPWLDASRLFIATPWEVLAWAVAFAAFFATRHWLEAMVVAGVAIIDSAVLGLSWLVSFVDGESAVAAFSSAHVFGATLLYGFLAVAAVRVAGLVGLPVGILCAATLVGGCVERVVEGSDAATDVLSAIALSGLLLTALTASYLHLQPSMSGIPFIHGAAIPVPEGVAHAKALTSTLMFTDGKAYKMYSPGFVPRMIYWFSFQAPFAYAVMPRALEAAVARRNLAGLLTEYWFGERRVAKAHAWTTIDGHLALVSDFVDGHDATDVREARAFLLDLTDRFDEAGLPTWQIDPRQPRSLGNALEVAPGKFMVIDLESGLVSPVASPRAWKRAFRRGLVPLYDDVFFDITRAYIAREREAMETKLGAAWCADLIATLDEAERATAEWHAAEPRIWSRIVRGAWSGFGVPALPHRLHTWAEEKRDHADAWMEAAIHRWRAEGRISRAQEQALFADLADPGVVAMLPHFGVHLAIGVVLRFPLGSITRASYTLFNLLLATALLLARRIDRAHWRRLAGVHAPWVVLIAAMPGVGTFAYLASVPVLRHFLLARLAADAIGEKLPLCVYRRLGLKRVVAPAAGRHDAAA